MMRITFSGTVLALVAILSVGCGKPLDDAGRIARAIVSMEKGIEDKRAGPVLEQLAEDFRAGEDLQRREIRALMLYHFRRYPNIRVITSNQAIRVQGEQADVTLDALLLGGKTLLPERGQRYSVRMRWQKSGGDWRLTRIQWQRPGG